MNSPYAMNREDMRIMALPKKFLDNTHRTADEVGAMYFIQGIRRLRDMPIQRCQSPMVVSNGIYDMIEENYPESLHHYARMEPKVD